jgi:hypothetical protein
MKLINLTPHALTLRDSSGHDLIVEASGQVARVATTPGEESGNLGGVALFSATSFGKVEGLPAPQDGVIYIVSGLVGGQVSDRDDVVVPGTGPRDGAIREDGRIVAVTRLIKAC